MKIAFLTREKLSYDEAPPSRMLNIKKVLDEYHDVYIISQKRNPEIIKGDNFYTIPCFGNNFFSKQLYKIVMFFVGLYFIFIKRIRVIIVREYYYIPLLWPFARIVGAKVIYDMHCFRYKELLVENKPLKSFTIAYFEKLSHILVDYLMPVGQALFDDLNSKLQKKAFIVQNGVDTVDFRNLKKDTSILKKYNIPSSKKLVGFIGNWMEWVDVETLLKSSKEYPDNVQLVIAGECYKHVDFPRLKKEYSNVIFTGRIPHNDVLDLLAFFDVCVLPYKKAEVIKHLSVRKTFEYLAAGKAIIMSDSDISERKFLKEGVNYISYEPENPSSLSAAVKKIISDDKLIINMGDENKKIAVQFDWKNIVINSDFLKVLKTYLPSDKLDYSKTSVTIVIKALNEEEHVEESIKSALLALEGLKGEVILVDSLSSDRTVDIAKKYPIKIVQIKDKKDRCCGIGPQIGYLNSQSDFIYILDGDMVIDKDFIKKALCYFNDSSIAGVGGNIIENSKNNLAFQVRNKHNITKKIIEVNQLGMGGLYRRIALDKVGFFSNPYFYAYEEYDLGTKLKLNGYALLRLPEKMIDHFGDVGTSFSTLVGRWKSNYILGSGQYLKASLKEGHFWKTFWNLNIYIFTLIWLIIGLTCVVLLSYNLNYLLLYLLITIIIFWILAIKKRSILLVFFSFFSWNLQAIGMLKGFSIPYKKIKDFKQEVQWIKK